LRAGGGAARGGSLAITTLAAIDAHEYIL